MPANLRPHASLYLYQACCATFETDTLPPYPFYDRIKRLYLYLLGDQLSKAFIVSGQRQQSSRAGLVEVQ